MPATACPQRVDWAALLEGRLDAQQEAALAAHVGQCPACRGQMEALAAGDRAVEPWVRTLRDEQPAPGPALSAALSSWSVRPADGDSAVRPVDGDSLVRPAVGDSARERAAADEQLAFLDPPDAPDCIGRLGAYRVLKLVGRGGMGVVFQARDPVLSRLVAIKVLRPHLGDDAVARERFLREARAAAKINHPHVVTIYSADELDNLLLLVMEYVDGVTLQQRLAGPAHFSLPEIVRIGVQAASGLAAAHNCGLVHRDIKPGNILLARPGDQTKIADFGLARSADETDAAQAGFVAGTPAYMAPEQARGEALDHRADLFSLGSVLYALCTGHAPYSGSNGAAVVRQVAAGPPEPLSAAAATVPAWLAQAIAKLHAMDPAERFQSAAEVAQLFRRQWDALRRTTAAAPPPGTIPPPAPSHALVPPPRLAPEPPPVTASVRQPMSRARKWVYGVTAGLAVLATLLLVALWPLMHTAPTALPAAAVVGPPAASNAVAMTPVPTRDKSSPQPRLWAAGKPGRTTPPAASATGRFMLIGRDGSSHGRCVELPAAVEQAVAGDVLEIHGNEPVSLQPLHLHGKPLVLRAAAGAHPVLRAAAAHEPVESSLIQTAAALTLEGLDIQCGPAEPSSVLPPSVILVRGATLRLANCRLLHWGAGPVLRLENAAACDLRNSWLHGAQAAAVEDAAAGRVRLHAENCILSGFSAMAVDQTSPAMDATLELSHNTMVLREGIRVHLDLAAREQAKGDPRAHIRIIAAQNLWDTDAALLTLQSDLHSPAEIERFGRLSRGELGKNLDSRMLAGLTARANAALASLKKVVTWQSRQDLYSGSGPLLARASSQSPPRIVGMGTPATLIQWNEFWGLSEPAIARLMDGSFDGQVLRKAAADPRRLTATDYRRTTHARTGWAVAESRREGANISLVGPGTPYEAWKNTIDYHTWTDARP